LARTQQLVFAREDPVAGLLAFAHPAQSYQLNIDVGVENTIQC